MEVSISLMRLSTRLVLFRSPVASALVLIAATNTGRPRQATRDGINEESLIEGLVSPKNEFTPTLGADRV